MATEAKQAFASAFIQALADVYVQDQTGDPTASATLNAQLQSIFAGILSHQIDEVDGEMVPNAVFLDTLGPVFTFVASAPTERPATGPIAGYTEDMKDAALDKIPGPEGNYEVTEDAELTEVDGEFFVGDQSLDNFDGVDIQDDAELSAAGSVLSTFLETDKNLIGAGTLNITGNLTNSSLDISELTVETGFDNDDITVGVDQVLRLTTGQGDSVALTGVGGKVEFIVDDPASRPVINADGINTIEFIFAEEAELRLDADSTLISDGTNTTLMANGGEVDINDIPLANISEWDMVDLNSGLSATPAQIALFGGFSGTGDLNVVVTSLADVTDLIAALEGGKLANLQGRFDVDARTPEAAQAAENNREALEQSAGKPFDVTRPLTLADALAAQADETLPDRFNLADDIGNLTGADEQGQDLLALARSINVQNPATIAQIQTLDEVDGVALGKIRYELTSANAGTELSVADAQAAKAVFDGAQNRADLTFEATLYDTLANLEPAQTFIADNALPYRLLADADLGELTLAQIDLVNGATNADAFTYTVKDSLENILEQGTDADYELSNPAGQLSGLSMAEAKVLQGAGNADDYTYTLADTFATLISPANAELVDAAESYAFTNEAEDITALTVAQYDFFTEATNASDYTEITLNDSLANLVARAFPPAPEPEEGEEEPAEGEPEEAEPEGLPEGVPYSVTDPQQENLLVREAEILMGATNADEATYTLRDTLDNLYAAEAIRLGAESYELNDEDLNLGPLSVAKLKVAEGATNSDIYEFSLAADQPALGELSVAQLIDIAPDTATQTFSIKDTYANIDTLIEGEESADAWLAYAQMITITDDLDADPAVEPATVGNIQDLIDISVVDDDDQVVRVRLEDVVFNLKDTAANLLANLTAVEEAENAEEDENVAEVDAIVAQAEELYVTDTVTGRTDFSTLIDNDAVWFEEVDADDATAAQMNQIVANADKIEEGGLSGIMTLSASQFVLEDVLGALDTGGVEEIANFDAATAEQKDIILANLDKIGTNPTFEFEDNQELTVAQYNQAEVGSFGDNDDKVEVKVNATDATEAQIKTFVDNMDLDAKPILDGGISGIKLTAAQFDTISKKTVGGTAEGITKLDAAGVIELNGIDPDSENEDAYYGADKLGVIATNIAKVANGGLINLQITNALDAPQIRALLGKATNASVDADAVDSDSKLFEIADNIEAIKDGGITNLTVNGSLNENLIGTLLSKAKEAEVDAEDMTQAMLQAVVTHIGNVDDGGITGLELSSGFTADELTTLLSKADDATVNAQDMGLAQLRNVAAGTDGIEASGITSLSVDNQLTDGELTSLLEKAEEAKVNANTMTTAQLKAVAAAVAAETDSVADKGITNLSIAGNSLFANEIGGLLGKATGATVDASATMTSDRRDAVQENFAGVGTLTAGDRNLNKIDPDDLAGQTINGTGTLTLNMDDTEADAINFSGTLEGGLNVVLTGEGTINMTTATITDVASLDVGENVTLQLRQAQITELGDKLTGTNPDSNVLDLAALKGTEHEEDLSDLEIADEGTFTVELANFNEAGNKSDLEDGRGGDTKSDFTIELPELSKIEGTLEIVNMTIGQENGEPNDILVFQASDNLNDKTLGDAIETIEVSEGYAPESGTPDVEYLTLTITLSKDGEEGTIESGGKLVLENVVQDELLYDLLNSYDSVTKDSVNDIADANDELGNPDVIIDLIGSLREFGNFDNVDAAPAGG